MQFVVHPDKVTLYLLNPSSPAGAGKSRFFHAYGFDRERPQQLMDALLAHPATAVLQRAQLHPDGRKLVYECALSAPDGRRPCIRSIWIHSAANDVVRLVTAYPFE